MKKMPKKSVKLWFFPFQWFRLQKIFGLMAMLSLLVIATEGWAPPPPLEGCDNTLISNYSTDTSVPGDSDCLFANGTPGCDDPDCQDTVCAIDSFCCVFFWDSICAGEAEDLCGENPFVEIANVGSDLIDLDACSLVTFNVFTETSIGDATVGLSGILAPFETVIVELAGMPPGPGAFGIYEGPPPLDGTPFSTEGEITGMVYLNNDTVFGISHLTVAAHNDIYACIYGGSGQGPFTRPFDPIGCLEPNG